MPQIAGYLIASFVRAMLVWSSLSGAAIAQSGQPMLLPVDPITLVAKTVGGEQTFSIEVADDNNERSRGLMFRRQLPDDRGMLFVFEATRRVAFWMKNTPLPLDLIFIRDDGKVQSIGEGVPFSERPIAATGPVRFVLELKKGTAAQMGIAEGVRLHHPRIDAIAGSD